MPKRFSHRKGAPGGCRQREPSASNLARMSMMIDRRRRMSKAAKLAGSLLGLGLGIGAAALAADVAPSPSPIKIVLFPFELEDFSAAGAAGSAPDEAKYLVESTKEERLLLKSGRYLPIDVGSARNGPDIRDCNGC